jgi:hypothetical protein
MTPVPLPPSAPVWDAIPTKAYSLEYLLTKTSHVSSLAFKTPALIKAKSYSFPALYSSMVELDAARLTKISYKLDHAVIDIKAPRPVFDIK